MTFAPLYTLAQKGEPAVFFGAIRLDFSPRRAGWPPSIALISRCVLFCFLLLIPFGGGRALENKACSDLIDREALRRVRTVCVDTSYLEAGVASDVKEFVARENQPGQLLKHLAWEFTDQCTAADAVIRVYFGQSERHITLMDKGQAGGVTSSESVELAPQAVVLVYDRASVRLLYRAEAQGGARKGMALLKGPFSKLIKDIKGLGP